MHDVAIGSHVLQPNRQLLADGERVPLGRRALAILTVLAEAHGGIVTKDELLEAVWHGIVVEENALQVHVAALRKALGPDAERLKTIRGVGYQLDLGRGIAEAVAALPSSTHAAVTPVPPGEASSSLAQTALGKRRSRFARSILAPSTLALAALGLLLVALLGATGWTAWTSSVATVENRAIAVEAIRPIGGGRSRELAENLHGQVIDILSVMNIATVAGTQVGQLGQPPSFAISGSAEHAGALATLQIVLTDSASGSVLWSKRIQVPAADADRAATLLAVAAARTMYALRDFDLQPSYRPDPTILALHIRGSEIVRGTRDPEDRAEEQIFRVAIAHAPHSAVVRAMHALTLLSSVDDQGSSADRIAEREAQAAIALEPAAAGAAFDTLYLLSLRKKPDDLVAADAVLQDGLRRAPLFPFLWMRSCRLLAGVGRIKDALEACRRAAGLYPLAEPVTHSLAQTLANLGRDRLAQKTIEEAAKLSPDHPMTKWMRFSLTSFGGRPALALALLADPAAGPSNLTADERATLELFLTDFGHWSPAQRAELREKFLALSPENPLLAQYAVSALSSMGEYDAAFALLNQRAVGSLANTDVLFRKETAPLRADPRFWVIAARLGLADYWITGDRWPDICGSTMPLAQCRALAADALQSLHSGAAGASRSSAKR